MRRPNVIDIPADQIRQQTTDAEFVEAIRTGAAVSPDFEEGVQYMRSARPPRSPATRVKWWI